MVGISRGYDTVAIRGDMALRAFTAFYLKQGMVIAADAVNRPAEFMLARKWVAAGMRADAATLANSDVDLKGLTSLSDGLREDAVDSAGLRSPELHN
jgi:3-phenylpropionate/trans-cinnamate dioxygenase ferredoxin reductase subunit